MCIRDRSAPSFSGVRGSPLPPPPSHCGLPRATRGDGGADSSTPVECAPQGALHRADILGEGG
eukprot:9519265-Alexandrium_andersonii.AAC.1